ncbi:MAG: hypothetical protein V4679_02825 [Pseudomonadota bacterium]
MTTQPPPATSGRRPAGEFPQPVSPWESRGLLYAEVAGALVVLAMVLANSMEPGFWQARATDVAVQTAPAATALVTAGTTGSTETSE